MTTASAGYGGHVGDRPPKPVRRTQKERYAETERRVLDATMRLINDCGVQGLTLAAVGEKSGYSRGIVNHHFGTRQRLIEKLAVDMQAAVRLAPADGPGLDRVLSNVDAYCDALQNRPQESRAFFVLWAEAIAGNPDLRTIFAERDDHFRQVFADCLRRGIADRSVHHDVDPEAMALIIVGQLRGIAMQLQLRPDLADLDSMRHEVTSALLRALRGD